jgi:hypothetical protein
VTRFPFASLSWTATRSAVPTVTGESFRTTARLAAPPVMTVVSVADDPVIDGLVVASHWHVPGVVVDVTTKVAMPLTAVAVAVPAPPMLQTEAPVIRVTVTWVVLSEMTVLPFASWIVTDRREVEPSAAIDAGSNADAVLAPLPIGSMVMTVLHPFSEPELIEICAAPDAPATVV